MKAMCAVFLLACLPVAMAKSGDAYPKEKVAGFVVEKLDVTSMPSAIWPKREKGKRTFGDYGYVTRQLGDNEAVIESPEGGSQITISILDENKSGIFVCFSAQMQKQSSAQMQRVLVLKLKNGSGLLKGRESWREFDACPVIGGADNGSASDAYGGD